MQVSMSASLEGQRSLRPIGRVTVHTPWCAADRQLDREIAMRALVREAEEYDADALVEVTFDVEKCHGAECGGVMLHRLTATGRAVKLAIAA